MPDLFIPPETVRVPVTGTPDLHFPVRRIYCIGLNYAAHAQEIYQSTDKANTFFFFTKTRDTVLHNRQTVAFPMKTHSFQHEVELVVALGKTGQCIRTAEAEQHIYGFATGIDFTRRDLQKSLSQSGLPWDAGKVFTHSSAIGSITPLSTIGKVPDQGGIQLSVNGVIKQQANLDQMLFKIQDIIAELSHYDVLHPGDLIYTGTPQGTIDLQPGDELVAHIDHLEDLHITVGSDQQ